MKPDVRNVPTVKTEYLGNVALKLVSDRIVTAQILVENQQVKEMVESIISSTTNFDESRISVEEMQVSFNKKIRNIQLNNSR